MFYARHLLRKLFDYEGLSQAEHPFPAQRAIGEQIHYLPLGEQSSRREKAIDLVLIRLCHPPPDTSETHHLSGN